LSEVVVGFYVPDPRGLAKRIREAGLPIEREPDGYLIEILEGRPVR
jgi:hypothetical protein